MLGESTVKYHLLKLENERRILVKGRRAIEVVGGRSMSRRRGRGGLATGVKHAIYNRPHRRPLQSYTSVQGVYLSGSLAGAQRDVFSDIDLGIASRNSPDDFQAGLRAALDDHYLYWTAAPLIERGWEHCQMVAALYGKSQFPPVGLEVDMAFSELQHVGEQMPYANYVDSV